MGIDALDMHFRIEKTFQISISMEELRSLFREGDIRVGDLYEHLLNRLMLQDRTRYNLHLNYELWRDVQRMLQCATGRSMDEIMLETRLERLFPQSTCRAAWAMLQASTPHRLPQLKFTNSMQRAMGLTALGLTFCLLAASVWGLAQLGVGMLWPLAGLVMVWMILTIADLLQKVFAPFRTALPDELKTVKDLCRIILADNYQQICSQAGVAVDRRCLDVWHKLQRILQDTLGVDSSQITFQSRLVHDLGMD